METLTKDNLIYRIIGASVEVHRQLGNGFLEAVYQESLAIEFTFRGIKFSREQPLDIYYKGILLNKKYVADFICEDKIIVELKAVGSLQPEHSAQLINYLKATGIRKGILINFGAQSLEHKSYVW